MNYSVKYTILFLIFFPIGIFAQDLNKDSIRTKTKDEKAVYVRASRFEQQIEEVTISMEVGRSQISIRNLLQLNQGSVVELDRVAGEPLDVLVNGTLIAHGEVVVVNDKFGIRLTDVISQTERIKKLK